MTTRETREYFKFIKLTIEIEIYEGVGENNEKVKNEWMENYKNLIIFFSVPLKNLDLSNKYWMCIAYSAFNNIQAVHTSDNNFEKFMPENKRHYNDK